MTARLEAAAPANEIYIGDVTYRLVRDAVEAENVEPLTLKGISQRVLAYRIISAHGLYGNERRIDTVVVGRDAELSTLLSARAAVIATRRAHLVTVIGDPGVGKSRLVRELMDRQPASIPTTRPSLLRQAARVHWRCRCCRPSRVGGGAAHRGLGSEYRVAC